MRKCIIWGTGNDYEKLYNSIQFEVYKGNIEILAAVSEKKNIFCRCLDGIPLITKDVLGDFKFDYIIVCSNNYFDEICHEIQARGIGRNRVLDGQVFTFARFDFNRYIRLVENPVTIISDDCWGGEVYHTLRLPFSSPTINISWRKEEYIKFVLDLPYYLNQPLKCGRKGNLETGEYPVGLLGENEKKVQMELIHNISFDEAEEQWERRKKRVNYDNIFIKFGFNRTDDWKQCVKVFDSLQYNKICFCPFIRDKKGYINSGLYARWRWQNDMKKRVDSYDINDWLRPPQVTRRTMDLLALLNGETQYFRDSN